MSKTIVPEVGRVRFFSQLEDGGLDEHEPDEWEYTTSDWFAFDDAEPRRVTDASDVERGLLIAETNRRSDSFTRESRIRYGAAISTWTDEEVRVAFDADAAEVPWLRAGNWSLLHFAHLWHSRREVAEAVLGKRA